MEKLKNKLEETGTHLLEYYETQAELKKLQVIEKGSKAFSAASSGLLIILVFFFVLVFISVAAGFGIAEATGSNAIGFLCVAGMYLLLGILLAKNKDRWIEKPMVNRMIKSFFDENHETKN